MIDVMGSTFPFGEIVEAALEQQLGKLGYLEIRCTIGAFPNDPGECFPSRGPGRTLGDSGTLKMPRGTQIRQGRAWRLSKIEHSQTINSSAAHRLPLVAKANQSDLIARKARHSETTLFSFTE
jgi:hypothetical protein